MKLSKLKKLTKLPKLKIRTNQKAEKMEEEGDNRNPDAKRVAELEIQHFDESKSVGKNYIAFIAFIQF